MLSQEPQLLELSNQLYKHSQKVCCFDSDNSGNARLATIELLKYIKALWFTLYMPTPVCTKKLALQKNEEEIYKAILKSARVTTYIHTVGYGVFKPGDKMICLPTGTLISKEVLQFVNRVFPLTDKFNFGERAVRDFILILVS